MAHKGSTSFTDVVQNFCQTIKKFIFHIGIDLKDEIISSFFLVKKFNANYIKNCIIHCIQIVGILTVSKFSITGGTVFYTLK